MIPLDTITCMDALAFARTLPDNSVHCVVTSPPYYGLRDYGIEGQIGLEDTPQQWLARMVELFREIRRVLREDGVMFVNVGDSYATTGGSREYGSSDDGVGRGPGVNGNRKPSSGFKSKDLMMMPAELAIALRNDGYYLRSEIVWHKPNPMPESTRDRPTKAHEMVYLLTKAPRYWMDMEAIREPNEGAIGDRRSFRGNGTYTNNNSFNNDQFKDNEVRGNNGVFAGRNKRTVWTVATEPTPFAHFATFPQALIEPMILAGCPARVCSVCGAPYIRLTEHEPMVIRRTDRSAMGKFGRTQSSGTMVKPAETITTGWEPTCDHDATTDAGICYDPFMGAGTTGLVAMRLGRHYIGSELNPEYVALARERIAQADPYQPKAYEDGVTQLSLFAQEDEA